MSGLQHRNANHGSAPGAGGTSDSIGTGEGPRASERQCSRRGFLVASAASFAGILAACGVESAAETTGSSQVPVGSAIVLDRYIIAQPEAGRFVAYSAVCPHQGAKVRIVEGDTVICPSHGSIFDISSGRPLAGPTDKGLSPATVSIEGDNLTVSGH